MSTRTFPRNPSPAQPHNRLLAACKLGQNLHTSVAAFELVLVNGLDHFLYDAEVSHGGCTAQVSRATCIFFFYLCHTPFKESDMRVLICATFPSWATSHKDVHFTGLNLLAPQIGKVVSISWSRALATSSRRKSSAGNPPPDFSRHIAKRRSVSVVPCPFFRKETL